MKPNIEIDRKTIILISGVALAGIVFFLFIKPLWSKASSISQEVKVLSSELSDIRDALKKDTTLHKSRHPLSRGEVSAAINEIMEAGASFNIDFFTTNPQKIQKLENSKYPILPIRLEMQSTYENFGVFLGALERLDKSIVTVRQFDITRKPIILPDISVELVLEIHLKEGEGE